MTETWTSSTLSGINYYGRDLNIGDFGQHKLLWPEFGGWYLLIEEAMAMRHVILTKRETHVGVGR